jgi:signal transduction histidine kinase
VDDDEVKRYTITRTLQRAGFDIVEGTTGADALRYASEAALLILDVKLPDLDGYEVCRRLKADPVTAGIPVLLMSTTFVGPASRVEGLESGADAYLTDVTEPPVVVATARALLRMRHAEEQARRDATRLRVALEAGQLGEWDLDLRINELVASPRCKLNFGRPADAPFTYADLLATIHPDDRTAVERAVRQAIAERSEYDIEHRIVCVSGEVRWVLVRGLVVGGFSRQRMIGVVLDVTERKRIEQAFRDADRRKDEFLALLAHELRNPLAPIRNGLQVMRLAASNPDAIAKSRDIMERQVRHMVRLIDDLLDISRISRNKMELRRARVLLTDVVAAAVETVQPVIDAAGHTLTLAIPSEPLYLDADLTRLAQVFSNLLTNSAKYTERGGQISLAAHHQGSEVVVSVRDTGIGIPAEALPTIFDMFSQVDRSIERSTGGLGIGLALVKGLVEMHGGVVTAHSGGLGKGSLFTVRLPGLESPAKHEHLIPADKTPIAGGAGRRILVADDSRDTAASMASLLAALGHEVRTVHDGIAAVQVAGEFRPEVIIMDVGMPRLNGYDACRLIREQLWGKDATIIALTGWAQDDDRRLSKEAGCDAHLIKPVFITDLVEILSRCGDSADLNNTGKL